MSDLAGRADAVVPAQLAFLAIYNPTLGATDETLLDQIVYYSQPHKAQRSGKSPTSATRNQQHEEQNERLRQIGLAQGMVNFTNSFAGGERLNSIETEKSRIVLHELEPGWWILASIDLTRLSSSHETQPSSSSTQSETTSVEYSSREVCPPDLLLQHIIRAHSIFLLHHAPSLADLYVRISRPKFCKILERFWNKFVWDWDVLLHGNPAVDIYNGLKLAAGGELGIGVGEEEWGSGEREVLEDFIRRTEGIVDLVVSRFGEAPDEAQTQLTTSLHTYESSGPKSEPSLWLGCCGDPRTEDGMIFSGTGAIARSSLKEISNWIELIYKYGHNAYGVGDNPNSIRHGKRRKKLREQDSSSTARDPRDSHTTDQIYHPGGEASKNSASCSGVPPANIPPPIVRLADASLNKASASVTNSLENEKSTTSSKSALLSGTADLALDTETIIKYLTLGVYGSSWGFQTKASIAQRNSAEHHIEHGSTDKDLKSSDERTKDAEVSLVSNKVVKDHENATKAANPARGCFVVGLQGELEQDVLLTDLGDDMETGTDPENVSERGDSSNRIMIRTLYISREKPADLDPAQDPASNDKKSATEHSRLRVVVYVHQPFIFTFLFEPHTDSLSISSFYRSIHHQLGPLQRPLLASTSPANVRDRLSDTFSPKSTTPLNNAQPIFDFVYDPSNLTIHTTIPAIPEPGTPAAEGLGPGAAWTRIEALNVHSQILNTYISTRRYKSEFERTCKTGRGWWVVWMRIPHRASVSEPSNGGIFSEAFLIRKASDYVSPALRKTSGRFGRDASGSSLASGWGPGKLAEGIGIDARKYIEGLLSLNR